MRERDDSGHDGLLALDVVQVADEGSVDLDEVERELLQIGERGVAGPEVIEADLNADVSQGAEPGHRRVGRLHEDSLGDLDLKVVTGHAGGVEQLDDRRREALIGQMTRRHVDGDLDEVIGGQARSPGGGLVHGVPQDQVVHDDQQACLFGHLQKGLRLQQSAAPVVDPNERFRADALAGKEVDDRLILDNDPPILKSAAQHALGHQPADGFDP